MNNDVNNIKNIVNRNNALIRSRLTPQRSRDANDGSSAESKLAASEAAELLI